MQPDSTLPGALDILDGMARHTLGLSPGLRFGLAQTPDELEAVFRLRYAEVIERGWAEPDTLSTGLERDAYDDGALQVVVWDGSQLAAITRLVLPQPDRLLPTEAAFDLRVEPQGRVVDAGRTVIAAPYRQDPRHRLLRGLIGQCWLEIRARGFADICAVLTLPIIRLYDSVGFHGTILGAPRPYWGEDRYPYRFDMIKTAEVLRSAPPRG